MINSVTVVAPINIAFIKYWGKRTGENCCNDLQDDSIHDYIYKLISLTNTSLSRGECLILPVNDSFSITLDVHLLHTKTSVMFSDQLKDDTMYLNGIAEKITGRICNILTIMRELVLSRDFIGKKVLIVSENNFPTAVGMASSASGLCALSLALLKLFNLPLNPSIISRIGSGSACRSVFGGFVRWYKGVHKDGRDCIAKQIFDSKHWPELVILCCIVDDNKKIYSSTKGMQLSLETSPMMPERITNVVPERIDKVTNYIKNKDFHNFSNIVMQESNDLHKICNETIPTINYLTSDSENIKTIINYYNSINKSNKAAYTFDAGPNAFIFTLFHNVAELVSILTYYYPIPLSAYRFNSDYLLKQCLSYRITDKFKHIPNMNEINKPFSYLLQSPVGQGPKYLPNEESLIHTKHLNSSN